MFFIHYKEHLSKSDLYYYKKSIFIHREINAQCRGVTLHLPKGWASEYHDGQVNVLSCLPDWASCLATKNWASLNLCFHCRIIFFSTWNFVYCGPNLDLTQYNIAIYI